MARISTETRNKVIADRVSGASIREIAATYGISTTSVQRIIKSDPELTQKVTEKKKKDTADILAYMDENAADIKRLLSKFLKGMEYKIDNLDMFTSLRDIATAYGVVFDKAVKSEEIRLARGEESNKAFDDWLKAVEAMEDDNA